MKQAVVLIHGIGEQVPMDTLRGFVDAVWASDATAPGPKATAQVWSKPDLVSGDFELRRLTTAENRDGRRTDFFEFYWAHMMEGTEVSHLLSWAKTLLLRWPWNIPRQLRGIWFVLVGLALGVAVGTLLFSVYGDQLPAWLAPMVGVIGSAAWVGVGAFVVKQVAGDAARYLHVAPGNIQSRHKIREAGVNLLEKLHDSPKYDRIIVVGHSLGSVIGYDILTHYWARVHDQFGATAATAPHSENAGARAALDVLEALAREPSDGADYPARYQAAQGDYFAELRAAGHRWRVTDFVTAGSPLAHGAVLLGRDETEFARRKEQREFPTCPPVLEAIKVDGATIKKFTFAPDRGWIPHHAAVFGPTRWSNLYFPCSWTIHGDVVGGKLRPAFGPGIWDIPVETTRRGGFFSHTLYWAPGETPAPSWIVALREAVRICLTPLPTATPPTRDPGKEKARAD